MNRRQVIVELTPDRVVVSAYEGRGCVGSGEAPITQGTEPRPWAEALGGCTAAVAALVEKLGVASRPTTVLYHSPTLVVDFKMIAVRSAGRAVGAGKLACADSLPYPAAAAVCRAAALARATSEQPQTLVVVAADEEATVTAIAEMVVAAKLKLVAMTSCDAAIAAELVGSALADRGSSRAWLYVGNHSSFFFVTADGALVFSRQINLGVQNFIDALTGPVRVRGRDDIVQLDSTAARAVFRQFGIPDPDQVVQDEPRLLGQHVMPLLQPVLQHYVIELRQSLRFGVSEGERARLTLLVAGPGAGINGLTRMLGQQLGLASANHAPQARQEAAHGAGVSAAALAAMMNGRLVRQLNLLPRALAHQQQVAPLRRWLWAGAAAAILVVGADAWRFHTRLVEARQQAETYDGQMSYARALESTSERLQAAITAQAQMDERIGREIGQQVDAAAYLWQLARVTPPGVRLTGISLHRSEGTVVGTVSGYAMPQEGGAAKTGLEAFMEALAGNPQFADVKLASVQRENLDSRPVESFDVTMTAVGAAPPVRGPSASLVGVQEAQP